jgi:hypothetical protein
MPLILALLSICQTSPFTYIENDAIRLGIDLKRGGSIGYFAEVSTGKNVVNTHDLGRWVGPSYYAGPKPFGTPHEGWKDWPWNPVSAGDVYGFAGEVLEKKIGKDELYIRTRPKQWALKNTPAECTIETWIVLKDRTAEIRHRLNNDRKDDTQYPAMDQELPAIYTIGSLHRTFAYTGDKPFTNAKFTEIAKKPAKDGKPDWSTFYPTEGWAVQVNDDDFGLGIIHPGVGRFLGGFYGKETKGGTADDATGYLAPVRREILDAKIVYEYRYVLVLDSVSAIRKYAVDHRPKESLPDYRFAKDLQGWTYANASDDGPPKRLLKVKLEKDDPQLIGPEGFWLAADVPVIFIRAAFQTKQTTAELYWQTMESRSFNAERSVRFEIVGDGKMRTYAVELSKAKAYCGAIVGLRFDPVEKGNAGEWVEVEMIGGKKE